ncbi:conserved Plasmodium protein, unknown function [Plasmodium berghei]|uniref:RRM domain-containing protein n=2 Tax=Plasmodium berghei TaxID=5821 RepID=A0A509AU32_PLABA|nr:conserved Plasmodium protein, unknown function [Plasmodium berghei ANKA]CXJ10970.1 conserved Plasmodium protein, unknown function [Plasmodium berghei]SCM25991.1 conserved Plasmodium protein, unknown function [Plasmodium berghei]SCN28222.1 conserved Plasmodium protein, unknown function [Plasmodium berghei]SCO62420.1 conserved Plasmodium protein, unknown function [Plasmodium berghei]SCO63978.1 conserved Plasmodium protein, unknown function [Plasmodium berghei]|eukprot:XP_034423874.1 conserved Plasmodium protein, unknown function [Plasmodium berghei ANKA]
MLGKRKLGDTQPQKKKKKWVEELDSDSEDIDLDYLNNLDENDKIQLEEVSDKENELLDQVEKEENKENKDGSQNMEDTINDGNNNKNKKRRYDWMSSDDEDIPSDDEDEDIEENDNIEDFNNNIENQKYKNGKEENNNDIKNNYSNPIDEHKNEINKIGDIDDIEKSSNEIIENINKYSIDQIDIKFEEIEHIITYVYFHNIHFDCMTENLVTFLENHTKNKIIQINSDKSTNHAVIYKYDEKNDEKVVINKFSHYGKLFVHVKNYQDVLRLLKLNETQFMGRIIKSAQAYRKKNSFFTLQTPSHYKYFIQVAINEKNKNNASKTWMR